MDYTKAVKGSATMVTKLEIIESQALIEFGRNLSKSEVHLVSKTHSPTLLCEKINKV